jgi:hypothetical protein
MVITFSKEFGMTKFLDKQVTLTEAIIQMMLLKLDKFGAVVFRYINGVECPLDTDIALYWINPDSNGEYFKHSPINKGICTLRTSADENRQPLNYGDITSNDFNIEVSVRLYGETGPTSSESAPYLLQGCYFHGTAEEWMRNNGNQNGDIIATDINPDNWDDGVYRWVVKNNENNSNLTWGILYVWIDDDGRRHGLAVHSQDRESVEYAKSCYMRKVRNL